MARDFFIHGEALVFVKGRLNTPLNPGGLSPGDDGYVAMQELGLSEGDIRLRFIFKHKDIHVDDFGREVPAEVLYMLSEVHIYMVLIHVDKSILQYCMAESMGGGIYTGLVGNAALNGPAGSPMIPAYTPMHGGQAVLQPNNKLISLNIKTFTGIPRRFRACYLTVVPVEWPIGTTCSAVSLTWRAIPTILSMPTAPDEGDDSEIRDNAPSALPEICVTPQTVLFDHTLDT